MRPFLACLLFAVASAQQIPPGVRYHRAPDAVNKQAHDVLAKILSGEAKAEDLAAASDKIIVCGPTLWTAIKGSATGEMAGATDVTFVVPGPGGNEILKGRGFKTEPQRKAFWKILLARYKQNKSLTIRKANADELSYYWAMIPYDIDEPLFIAVTDKDRLLFDFSADNGAVKIFTVELIPDKK
ncbi:MAG TPA: hypothetical protein VHE55_19075 [Fimbriimonadaceae bacterium]|nr:hypothetical protein [Fimbriimonadaceae bacterium]